MIGYDRRYVYSNGDIKDLRLADLRRLARLDRDVDGGRDATGKRPRRPSAQANNNASPEVVGSASGGSIMARKQSRAPEDVPSMKSSALSELVGSARRGSTMARKRDRDAEDEDAEGGHRIVKRRRTPMEWFGFASLFGEIEA